MPYVWKTDPQNPKLQSVRCQPGWSTLGLSTGLPSGGSLAWARPGWAACSVPSTPPVPGSLGGGGGGLLGPCLAGHFCAHCSRAAKSFCDPRGAW